MNKFGNPPANVRFHVYVGVVTVSREDGGEIEQFTEAKGQIYSVDRFVQNSKVTFVPWPPINEEEDKLWGFGFRRAWNIYPRSRWWKEIG